MPTTSQQNISSIHPKVTTPQNKNTAFPQTTIQSTVKTSVTPNYSQMNYQTFRPATTLRQTNKQKFVSRNYFQIITTIFCKKKTNKITKPPYMNSQNQPQAKN